MKGVRAGSKDLRALQRDLRAGLSLESDGKSKVVIVDEATGEPLRQENGRPLGMPNSPKASTVRIIRRRLADAGLLREGCGR